MLDKDFTHLHLHTTYSMLDGAIRIPELMKHLSRVGMSSVAITDHGNMYGAIEFYKEAKKNNIKPIIGSEFYVSKNRSEEKELESIPDGNAYHLILLAKNKEGYQNLIKLSSRSFTEGFYKKPRIDYDLLSRHSEGLICLTACLAGEVQRKIMEGNETGSIALANQLHEIFHKEDFYLEIQKHGIKEQEIVAKKLYEFSKSQNIPLVLTNDSHFLYKEDQSAQDILLRIGTQKKIDDHMRFGFNSEFYVKSPEEMAMLFPEIPDAYHNTLNIRDKCNLSLEFGNHLLPEFKVPEGYDSDSYLSKLVEEGILKKYKVITEEIRKRVDFEMKTIENMRFSGYFLIVQDYINFAKKSGIPVGPGRGSAAGSIVAFAVGITNVDPLKYGLLFERFLNPDRKDMPDVDTDFCVEKREEVINYIKEKYGENKVGQIITFNTMAAKASLKDVARVLNISFQESNEITKAFPPKVESIEEAVEMSADLKVIKDRNEINQKLFFIASKLEGNYRQPGRHAAGVVISPEPLETIVPLSTVSEKGKTSRSIVTQFDKDQLESVGLIKMDILGLQNLTTLDTAIHFIEDRHKISILPDDIPLDDPNTFSVLRKANTLGIFQLESSGMTDLVARSQVSSFEEIVALIALYRPGPMDSGMLQDYLDRKSGKQKVTYPHSSCEPILKETYGVAVYQEQVMSISRIVGGFTMGESDQLRKAMAKKKADLMDPLRKKFIDGALKNGHEEKWAKELFDLLEKFGGYGFNKSHSVAYALITYQTAYFKANYPTEYMTALMVSVIDDTTKIVKFINNAREMGIKILNPDVNESEASFSIPADKTIRFGISALKGVGNLAANAIIEGRKKKKGFSSITDFLVSIDPHFLNKKVLEALIQAGAMDSFGYTRKCLFESMDVLLQFSSRERSRAAEGQGDLFLGSGSKDYNQIQLPIDAEEWSIDEKLRREKLIVGLFLSGHPLDKYAKKLKTLSKLTIDKADSLSSGIKIELCGLITKPEVKFTKKNEEFVNFKLEDYTGEIDCTIFPKSYAKYKDLVKEDQAVFIKGVLDKVEIGEADLRGQILVNSIEVLDDENLERKLEKSLHIKISTEEFRDLSLINKLYGILTSFKGNSNVYFHIILGPESKKVIKAHDHYSVDLTKEMFEKLSVIIGSQNIFYTVGEELKKIAG
jgi:DNA polymerase III subunit alpha